MRAALLGLMLGVLLQTACGCSTGFIFNPQELYSLPQLPEERIRLLDISHTAVTDIRTLTEASYHDLILSYQATMDWETLGACNTYQFTVLDCPLDRQVAVRTALENRVEYATELPVQSDELLSKTMRGEISFS
mgnify:CR=1 FL=1